MRFVLNSDIDIGDAGCWLLGKVAVYADPAMLEVTNLDHASPATILFQRGSVITTDIVPALGTELCWWKSSRLYRPSTAARPQGGVQAAGGQAPPPLPRGAHGHLHHHLRRHVPGSSEKYFVIHKNLFKLFSCSPGPDKRTRALAHGRESPPLSTSSSPTV